MVLNRNQKNKSGVLLVGNPELGKRRKPRGTTQRSTMSAEDSTSSTAASEERIKKLEGRAGFIANSL